MRSVDLPLKSSFTLKPGTLNGGNISDNSLVIPGGTYSVLLEMHSQEQGKDYYGNLRPNLSVSCTLVYQMQAYPQKLGFTTPLVVKKITAQQSAVYVPYRGTTLPWTMYDVDSTAAPTDALKVTNVICSAWHASDQGLETHVVSFTVADLSCLLNTWVLVPKDVLDNPTPRCPSNTPVYSALKYSNTPYTLPQVTPPPQTPTDKTAWSCGTGGGGDGCAMEDSSGKWYYEVRRNGASYQIIDGFDTVGLCEEAESKDSRCQ